MNQMSILLLAVAISIFAASLALDTLMVADPIKAFFAGVFVNGVCMVVLNILDEKSDEE